MADPRNLIRNNLNVPRSSDIDIAFKESMDSFKDGIGAEAEAAKYSPEWRHAMGRLVQHVTAHLPSGWSLKRSGGLNGLVAYSASDKLDLSIGDGLTMATYFQQAENVIAMIKATGSGRS